MASSRNAEIATLVDDIIKNNKIAVFSKSYCPYCQKAKGILKNYEGVDAEILELDLREDGAVIQDYLQEKTGQRTVPNIFINSKHIGGSSDLADLENRKELADLITASA